MKTGEGIDIFWSEIGVRIWRTGRHSPHEEFPGVPPGYLVNYGPVVLFVYTSLQARQIQKNHSRERFYKDAISENGFRLEYVWKESRFMLKVLGLKNIWLRVDGTN